MDARLVAVGDAELAVCDWGSGDPILFLQTALTADVSNDRTVRSYR